VALVCGMWGRGIEEVGGDERIHYRFMWDMENFPWRGMGWMKKDVHTWYVILMEDGWMTWISCVALFLY
jgi:hypothetical protein